MTTDINTARTLTSMDPWSMGVKFARGHCFHGNDGTLYLGAKIRPIDWRRLWPAIARARDAQQLSFGLTEGQPKGTAR